MFSNLAPRLPTDSQFACVSPSTPRSLHALTASAKLKVYGKKKAEEQGIMIWLIDDIKEDPGSGRGSPYRRLLDKYFVQEIIFRSFTYHCVVLLSSFCLHSQPSCGGIREIKTFEKSTRKQGSEK